MSFLLYDIAFLILFTLFVVIFLYTRKKNLKREGILYLYRTQVGIRFINWTSKKFPRTLKVLQFFSILSGYVLMIVMVYLFFKLTYYFVKFPGFVKAVKIPPLMPLVPYLPEIFKLDFLPPFYFTYWIIVIAIIAIPHEFAHGIFARIHSIKIRSTGFGFLGPFLAAFVEPDEKKMSQKPKLAQISVLSAGSFANVIVSVLFLIIAWGFFSISFVEGGANFNTYPFSVVNISEISAINNESVSLVSFDLLLLEVNKTNLTKISARGETYLLTKENVVNSINQETEKLIAYEDAPAINAGLKGVIIEFNDAKILNNDQLKEELKKQKPGDIVNIKTKIGDEILSYELTLSENPGDKSVPYIGIASVETKRSGILGKVYSLLGFFKNESAYYEPRFDGDLIIFAYNLLWWIIIVSISVALVNMLPLGIFDGGRVFYLTMLALTKSEKTAEKLFRYMTWFILFIIFVMMFFWFLAIF